MAFSLDYGLGDHSSIPGRGKQNFPNESGVHAASNAVNNRTLSSGLNQLRCEADHLCSSTSEAKNAWNYTSIPHKLSRQAQLQLGSDLAYR